MAYYMAEADENNQFDELRLNPNRDVSEDDLRKIGIETTKVDFDDPNVEENLEKLIKQYDMHHRDEIHISKDTLPDFEAKLKIFFDEHLHNDAELRIIKKGVGYFDVRDANEKWIRIPVKRGDFVFLPAGIYHRFTPDVKKDVVAIRLFRNNPKWEAHSRSVDGDLQDERKQYLQEIKA
ncbi:unnamed protein product [Caenorhabditis bovis]|uniref:Acireductone dioxygenase n=1 Tax=Caenorhabditis bovis TaxID=2654633 RepID=A0A8S1EJJ6_9PELO|nr:unnamed protein product [Caenorhabditis bovis]